MPTVNSYHAPLPLDDLQNWVTSDTLEFLEQGDIKAAAFQAEREAEGADQIVDLFADDDSDASDRSDADFEGYYGRIRVWTSSSTNLDGFGGMYSSSTAGEEEEAALTSSKEDKDDPNAIRIVYIISESWEGYGDLLWASSRHLANEFADPAKCRLLLGPRWQQEEKEQEISSSSSKYDHSAPHPLENMKVLELGAGCGVPSLMAMKCGARVVCTDLDDPNRIRSLAEAIQRNWKELAVLQGFNTQKESVQTNLSLARACPFRWGKSTEPVLKSLNSQMEERFDVIFATDCLFMPWLHCDLLQGIDEMLVPNGVAIMAFAIHEGYSKDHEVWPFCDKASEKGFHVEILQAVQLTPPRKGMEAKQGLVHVLRLSRKQEE
jgi:predicted nicotinamide N-methyase